MKEIILGDKAEDVINQLIEAENIKKQQLADKAGVSRQSLNQSLKSNMKGMRCDTFKKIVEACGYEVVIRKIG